MDRLFTVTEISDAFWTSPPLSPSPSPSPSPPLPMESEESSKMKRSTSEWALRRFLQESSVSASSASPPTTSASDRLLVIETKDSRENVKRVSEKQSSKNDCNDSINNGRNMCSTSAASTAVSSIGTVSFNMKPSHVLTATESEDYQAFLKNKLNLACAAVALSRVSYLKSQDSCASSILADSGSQASTKPMGQPQAHSKGIPVKSSTTTSISSREQTDDEEVEGGNQTNKHLDPAQAKRVRRMLSNRESARRSRKRKQAHMTELETQVAELQAENSSLMKRFTDISQKFNEAAVDNRILKADLETLRTKVKMAEETIKRISGMNPIFQGISKPSSMSIQVFDQSPSDISTAATETLEDYHFHQLSPTNHVPTVHLRGDSSTDISSENDKRNMTKRTVSVKRVASLEHLQKCIRGSSNS